MNASEAILPRANESVLIVEEELLRLLPTTTQFYSDISPEIIFSISAAAILCIIVNAIYFFNVPAIFQNTPRKHIGRTLLLCGYYPVVALAAFVSIAVPRSILICDTICHLGFTFCAYEFFCLCLEYTKGESNFIKLAKDRHVFNIRTPPCCCCIVCAKPKSMTKNKFLMLRMLILQMPIIQTIIFVIFNIVYVEDEKLFESLLMYFIPFLGVSILSGVWGLQMTVRMISPLFAEYRLLGKYVCLQLVLVMVKLQPQISFLILLYVPTSNVYPLTTQVLSNIIVQLIILVEMVILSVWAQKLYKTPSRDELH